METATIHEYGQIPDQTGREIEFQGELLRPTLWNLDLDPQVWMTVDTLVQTGYKVDVNVGDYTAIRNYDGAEISATVDHSGFRGWFKLNPGVNTIKLTSSGIGTGYAILKYRAAFL